MRGQWCLVFDLCNDGCFDQLHIAFTASSEPVNLAAQAGLASIQSASIEKDGAADLTIGLLPFPIGLLHDADRDERPHAPIPSEHAGLLIEVGNVLRWHFQNHIQ